MANDSKNERGYGGLIVDPPVRDSDAYARFVNSSGKFGNREAPSELERQLPPDFAENGSTEWDGTFSRICYQFPRHPEGLSHEEVVEVARTLMEFGAERFTFLRDAL